METLMVSFSLALLFLPCPGMLHAVEPATARPRVTIAILPFENQTGDPDQVHWVEGVSDLIGWELAKVKALQVRSEKAVSFGLRQLRLMPGDRIDAHPLHTLTGSNSVKRRTRAVNGSSLWLGLQKVARPEADTH
jgi:hypothetical protein